MTDSRLASSGVLKDGASFTYNKDVAVMKQAILDSVIDGENSNLPSRDSLSVDDFTFTYYAQPWRIRAASMCCTPALPASGSHIPAPRRLPQSRAATS